MLDHLAGLFGMVLSLACVPVQVIDKVAAWAEVKTLAAYDDGNTATNTLYWVATRP